MLFALIYRQREFHLIILKVYCKTNLKQDQIIKSKQKQLFIMFLNIHVK